MMPPKIEVGDNYILGYRLYWRNVKTQEQADRLNENITNVRAVRRIIWRYADYDSTRNPTY